MTCLQRMSEGLASAANRAAKQAELAGKAARDLEEGFRTGDVGLQIRSVLPFLVRQPYCWREHGGPVDYTLAHTGQELETHAFAMLSPDGTVFHPYFLSSAEKELLRKLDEMRPDDEIYRVFCREAARDMVARPVEANAFEHYLRCLHVACLCWPQEEFPMAENWREPLQELLSRLKDFGMAETADL